MDVRAFGSYYGFSASLPYASGFLVNASGTNSNFAACRGIYVENANKNADKTLVVTLADAPGTPMTFQHIRTDVHLPVSITSISGISTVEHVYVFY
jgi:hypothetical protein